MLMPFRILFYIIILFMLFNNMILFKLKLPISNVMTMNSIDLVNFQLVNYHKTMSLRFSQSQSLNF